MRSRYRDGRRILEPLGGSGPETLRRGGLADDQGQYRIVGLPPGNYIVAASVSRHGVGPPDRRTAYVRTFYPGLVFDGEVSVGRLNASVYAVPLSSSSLSTRRFGNVGAEGAFAMSGLLGRHAVRIAIAPATGRVPEWFLKRVTLDGEDITDTGHEFAPGETVKLEIGLARTAATLSGVVRDDKGALVGGCTAVAFSVDSNRWIYGSRFSGISQCEADGTYRVPGLPAGEYYLVAVPDAEPGSETDPVELDRWRPRAVRAILGEAEAKTVNLTLIR